MLPMAGCGQPTDRDVFRIPGLLLLLVIACTASDPIETTEDTLDALDPAAWGSDHVGRPVPTYVTGGECLFCHREASILSWGSNRHSLTMRLPLADAEPIPANGAELLVGSGDTVRYLKRADYGKVSILSADGSA